MGLFGERKPVLVDLETGLIATWIRNEEVAGQPEFVNMFYAPFNSLKELKRINVRLNRTKDFSPHRNIEGAPESIKIILPSPDDQYSPIAAIISDLQQENENLREQIRSLKTDLRTQKQRAQDAHSGVKKQMSEVEELSGRRRNSPLSGHDREPGIGESILEGLR